MSDYISVKLIAYCRLCGYQWQISKHDPPPKHCMACNNGKGHGSYSLREDKTKEDEG